MSERKSTRVKTVAKALKRVDEDTRRQVRRDAFAPPRMPTFSPARRAIADRGPPSFLDRNRWPPRV